MLSLLANAMLTTRCWPQTCARYLARHTSLESRVGYVGMGAMGPCVPCTTTFGMP